MASGNTADVYGALTVISSQTPGSISVSSSPSGAYIKSLDGISYNGVLKTTCTIPNVNPGTHIIELTLAGYEDWSTSVGVNPGETATVSATLVPKQTPTTGTITVSSEPSGANVYLDNAYKGLTPITIPDVSPGTHTVELKLDGYSDWSTSVQVTVCHEVAREMRVWPLEAGLQEQASNRLKLLWLKAMVVSVKEKVPQDGIRCGSSKRT